MLNFELRQQDTCLIAVIVSVLAWYTNTAELGLQQSDAE